jgi:hypothetical protein
MAARPGRNCVGRRPKSYLSKATFAIKAPVWNFFKKNEGSNIRLANFAQITPTPKRPAAAAVERTVRLLPLDHRKNAAASL